MKHKPKMTLKDPSILIVTFYLQFNKKSNKEKIIDLLVQASKIEKNQKINNYSHYFKKVKIAKL